jgi:hypothetical protein
VRARVRMHVSAHVPADHSQAPADLPSATYMGTWLMVLVGSNALRTSYELLRICQCELLRVAGALLPALAAPALGIASGSGRGGGGGIWNERAEEWPL